MEHSERKFAAEQQAKFQIYLVALVFTMLGLAVQTAEPSDAIVVAASELLGWLLLLIAGLAGLSHQEWGPVLRLALSNKDELETKRRELQQAKGRGQTQVPIAETGTSVPIDERIATYDDWILQWQSKYAKMDRKSELKYVVLKWGLVAGLLSLAVSRGYTYALVVLHAVCA